MVAVLLFMERLLQVSYRFSTVDAPKSCSPSFRGTPSASNRCGKCCNVVAMLQSFFSWNAFFKIVITLTGNKSV